MARRILSADSALLPQAQSSLGAPAANGEPRSELRGGFFNWLQERWAHLLALKPADVLFDWDDRAALMAEIAFVNQTRERLDEAALKIAPSMLRIVLTVKANVADPRDQRAFIADHVDWDLRRVSELCIVADRYGLLDPDRREDGRREIARYGWSSALKLAYVADPAERREIWDRARNGRDQATYRAVLEEIRRFRDRRLIGPPATVQDVGTRLNAVVQSMEALTASTHDLSSAQRYQDALDQVARAQRELARLRRALRERMQAHETEALAESA